VGREEIGLATCSVVQQRGREKPPQLVERKTLRAALETGSVKAICSIHTELKKNHKGHCVPGFLLELVDRGYGAGFMIVYAFLVRSVTKGYNRLSLSLLGYASKLMDLLEDVPCESVLDPANAALYRVR
jgi:hypothetical protein